MHTTSIAVAVICICVILACATAAAAAAAADTTAFDQYNSTICQFRGRRQLANWGQLPFADAVLSAEPLPLPLPSNNATEAAFAILTTRMELFVARTAGSHNTKCETMSQKVALPPAFLVGGGQQCRLAAVPSGQQLVPSQTPLSRRVGGVAVACLASGCIGVLSANSGGAVSFAWSCAKPNEIPPQVTSKSKLWSVAVLPSTKTKTTSGNAKLLAATSSGLFVWSASSTQSTTTTISAIALTNTTGSVAPSKAHPLNVTHVGCLPASEISPGNYLSAVCFATSRNHVCDNACPADLVHLIGGAMTEVHFFRVPGIIDAAPTATAFDPRRGAVFFANSVCVNMLSRNGTLRRIDGERRAFDNIGGLPQRNLTSATFSAFDGAVWFGTSLGLAMLRPDWSWKYFLGSRFLPGIAPEAATGGMAVAAVATSGRWTLVATDGGVSLLEKHRWRSLEDKAMLFEQYGEIFSHFGIEIQHEYLKSFGNISTAYRDYCSNGNVWTSMVLAAHAFKFAVTKSAAARALAWRAFGGLELLLNVTGRPGLTSRAAFLSTDGKPPAGGGGSGWIASPTIHNAFFWPNASSDEVTGLFFGATVMHELVARTAEERARVAKMVSAVMSRIVDDGLVLIGFNGRRTQWGFWDDHDLNGNPSDYDDRGVNSLEILSYLSTAYAITKNETYSKTLETLVSPKYGYADNVVNFKITQVGDVDHSDDLLSGLALLTFQLSDRVANAGRGTRVSAMIRRQMYLGLDRWWSYIRAERPSLYAPIYLWYAKTNNQSSAAADADARGSIRFCLETWPLSIVRWPTDNSLRLDVRHSNALNRDGQPDTALLPPMLPYDEVSELLWNTNMWRKVQGSPLVVTNPVGQWNFPYWMARWLQVV